MSGKRKDNRIDIEKAVNTDDKKERRRQYFFVIRELTSREIKRKYSRSYLGIVWSVLNPLLSMTVISLIFTQIFRRSIENFPIYYLSGHVLWQLFTSSTNSAMSSLVDNRKLLIRVKLPMEIFILSRVYTALVNLGYSLVAYLVMLIVFRIRFSLAMLYFPVIVFFLLLFSLGISFILSTAYVFFGDVKHLHSVLLTLWMYCSAIFYPVDRLDGAIRTIIEINPIFNYIRCMRQIVLERTVPSVFDTIRIAVWGVAVYMIGYAVFRKNKNEIMQKI